MKLIKLNCPACAGALELPDNLTVAHCLYCGNKILLDEGGAIQERRNLERYIELCKVAVGANNHNDVIKYCNLILEIDPKNVGAWIDKALSTFWLTTGGHDRYDEAMEYLNRASQISQTDNRILDARRELDRLQALWLNSLGNDCLERGIRTYDIYFDSTHDPLSRQAQEHSQDDMAKAMTYYLRASNLDPNNLVILSNIRRCVFKGYWINWGHSIDENIEVKLILLKKLESQKAA
jgi:tetratricopeptide (TPR) repeat protein